MSPHRSSEEEQKQHLIPMPRRPSLRSFSTSSTATLVASPDEEKSIGILAAELESHTPQRSWASIPRSPIGGLIMIFKFIGWFLVLLVPSWCWKSTTPRKIHPTSYLDGLRGVAALIVFIDHLVTNWYYPLRNGYLNTPTDNSPFQLPFLRLLYAGRASVGVFFVISGFVLSHRTLTLARSAASSATDSKILTTLSSSLFRRAFRLYLPLFAGTLISAFLAYNELYTPVPSRGEMIPPSFATMSEQLMSWWANFKALIWVFAPIDPNRPRPVLYNGHLWTIPIEFEGSVVVFCTVLALVRCKPAVRMGLLAVICTWCLSWGRWDVWLFLGGVGLAEWSLILSSPSDEPSPFSSSYEQPESNIPLRLLGKLTLILLTTLWTPLRRTIIRFRTPLNILLLIASLYLLSYAGESPTPGYFHAFLKPLTPKIWDAVFLGAEHFYLSLGSLLFIFTLTNSPLLQSAFTTRPALYLGDISYSLYIIHGLVLFTLGTHIQESWTGQVGVVQWMDDGSGKRLREFIVRPELLDSQRGNYLRAFFVASGCCTVLVFWGADLFWRAVDGRCVRVGRWFEGLCFGRR